MDNIRDHFAGLAMQAIMQSEHHIMDAVEMLADLSKDIEMQDAIALLAYTQAEAMMKVRNKLNKESVPIIDKPSSEIVAMVKDKINEQKTVPIIEKTGGEAIPSEVHDICLTEGCSANAQTSYRYCPKHLREKHNEGFDDSNK
jgi:hypothetical protein